MSLSKTGEQSSVINIRPIDHGPEKMCNWGAIVTGLDMNIVLDKELSVLKEAIWKHKLLIIKGQKSLEPKKQWEFMLRLDPEAPQTTPELFMKDFHPEGEGLLKSIGVTGIPGAENVHLIGKGYQGDDHYGLKNLTLHYAFNNKLHAKELLEEDFENGYTRFQAWHFDAPLYKRDTAWFVSFRTIKLPVGPDMQVNWDDGSGLSMKCKPGRTAFFSSSQLYDLLTEKEKHMADHSFVEYMYYPYEWIRQCRGRPHGMGLVSEGLETSMEEMEKLKGRDPAWTKRYPMVWVNPLTGEKSFQVQSNAARKLFIRNSPDEAPQVMEELREVRAFLLDIQKRILRPEYILIEPEEEGDVLLWDNCGTMHTRIDYPMKYGPKTAHQAGIGASRGPVGVSLGA